VPETLVGLPFRRGSGLTVKMMGTIYILSDGTGETAAMMIRAALVQYSENEISMVRHKNIRNEDQVDPIIQDAFERKGLIAYTVVSQSLRSQIREKCQALGIPSMDLLGPLLQTLDTYLGVSTTTPTAGLLRVVDEQYYRRIEAIEYTVKHDDGKSLSALDKADIILVGISRTSKTPLSIFLSHKGWKVANPKPCLKWINEKSWDSSSTSTACKGSAKIASKNLIKIRVESTQASLTSCAKLNLPTSSLNKIGVGPFLTSPTAPLKKRRPRSPGLSPREWDGPTQRCSEGLGVGEGWGFAKIPGHSSFARVAIKSSK